MDLVLPRVSQPVTPLQWVSLLSIFKPSVCIPTTSVSIPRSSLPSSNSAVLFPIGTCDKRQGLLCGVALDGCFNRSAPAERQCVHQLPVRSKWIIVPLPLSVLGYLVSLQHR